MKTIAIALLWMLLAGCDYAVPLVSKPEIRIDKALLGVWEQVKESGEEERLLVLPLSDTEYLVSFPSETKNALFARACLAEVGDERIVQLRWFGTVQGGLPDDEVVYQYASFSVAKDTLAVQLLNPSVVPKTVASTEELLRAIKAGLERPDLFREPLRFQRAKG